MFLCSDEGKLTVIQHSHCEYWMNAFAHILIVELVLAEMACVSRNVRTTRPEPLPAFRSNGPFLSARSRILFSLPLVALVFYIYSLILVG